MRFAALFCAVFFSCTSIALADVQVKKAICDPGTKRYVEPVAVADGGKSALNKVTGTDNFCVNERITLGGSVFAPELVNEQTCICTNRAQLEQIGCRDGQRQPLVMIEISKKITRCTSDKVVISKCAADPEAAYEEACNSGVDLSYLKSSDTRSIEIADAGTARSMPSLGVVTGNDTLMRTLTASGVSETEARQLISQNRQGAIDYIRALAENDTEAVRTKADVLGINANLSTSGQQAVVDIIREQQDKGDPLAGKDFFETGAYRSGSVSFSGGDGFYRSQNGLPVQCGVQGYAGNFMLAESGCNRAPTNAANPYVGGAHHYLCSTWQGDVAATGLTQYRDCNYRFDPAASSQVVNARYAQHEQSYGGQCRSAGVSVSSCMYAIHVFGEGGFRNMLAAQQQDPNASAASLCGRAVSVDACRGNSAIFTNGGTVQGVFGELDRRLSGSTVINTYARGTGMSVPTGQSYSYSAVGGFSGQGQVLAYNSQSPFGQVNVAGDLIQPLLGGMGFGQLFNTNRPQNPYPPTQQPIQQPTQQPPIAVPPTTTSTSTETIDPNPPKAVLSVHIQPKTVAIAQSFTVAWTSVGTKNDCVLSADGKEVTREQSGTRRVTMQIAATVRYTLACTALSGERVEAHDTVTVK